MREREQREREKERDIPTHVRRASQAGGPDKSPNGDTRRPVEEQNTGALNPTG